MVKTMICQRCGAEISRRGRAQKYCPVCSKIMKKATRHRKKPVERSTKENKGLLEASMEANKRHISYGEYMRLRTEKED